MSDDPTEAALGPLDPHRQVLIAYAEMAICNPLSVETLDRVLSQARLDPGARTLDLGCGNAAVSVHLAERWGCEVEALERSPAVAALARARIAASPAAARVRLNEAASADWLPGQAAFQLVAALGVSGVVEGAPEPARVLQALRPHVADGGWLLWGDPFLKREPSEPMRAMMGPYAAYLSNADNVSAGEGAGFQCRYAAASPDRDWDDYLWTVNASVERWIEARPGHRDTDAVRARARLQRTLFLMEGRETLGFGLYLFRAA